jgi:hypothetical protein
MIRIAKYDLRLILLELTMFNGFDIAERSHGHENWRLNFAVSSFNHTRPCT